MPPNKSSPHLAARLPATTSKKSVPLGAIFERDFEQQSDGRATVAPDFVVKCLQGVSHTFLLLVVVAEFE